MKLKNALIAIIHISVLFRTGDISAQSLNYRDYGNSSSTAIYVDPSSSSVTRDLNGKWSINSQGREVCVDDHFWDNLNEKVGLGQFRDNNKSRLILEQIAHILKPTVSVTNFDYVQIGPYGDIKYCPLYLAPAEFTKRYSDDSKGDQFLKKDLVLVGTIPLSTLISAIKSQQNQTTNQQEEKKAHQSDLIATLDSKYLNSDYYTALKLTDIGPKIAVCTLATDVDGIPRNGLLNLESFKEWAGIKKSSHPGFSAGFKDLNSLYSAISLGNQQCGILIETAENVSKITKGLQRDNRKFEIFEKTISRKDLGNAFARQKGYQDYKELTLAISLGGATPEELKKLANFNVRTPEFYTNVFTRMKSINYGSDDRAGNAVLFLEDEQEGKKIGLSAKQYRDKVNAAQAQAAAENRKRYHTQMMQDPAYQHAYRLTTQMRPNGMCVEFSNMMLRMAASNLPPEAKIEQINRIYEKASMACSH